MKNICVLISSKITEKEEEKPIFEYVDGLQYNIQFFCKELQSNGINAKSETAIIPIIIGDEQKTLEISKALLNDGIYISAIRYPTVAKGSARLRVALMSSHTQEELKFTAKKISLRINEVLV